MTYSAKDLRLLKSWGFLETLEFGFNDSLSSIDKMITLGEANLEGMERELSKDLERYYPPRTFTNEDEEMAHANSEADFYYFSRKEIEDYRDLMWKSVLVTIMSTLEQTLNDIADEFSSEFNKPIGQSGRDNNIIKVRHRYFSDQLSIPDNMLDVYYIPITNTIKVRNALVHKSSRLDSSLMQIVRSIPGFVVFASFGQDYLRIDTPEFLRELSHKVRKYVYDIIDRVDQYHSDQEKIARENGNLNLPATSSNT